PLAGHETAQRGTAEAVGPGGHLEEGIYPVEVGRGARADRRPLRGRAGEGHGRPGQGEFARVVDAVVVAIQIGEARQHGRRCVGEAGSRGCERVFKSLQEGPPAPRPGGPLAEFGLLFLVANKIPYLLNEPAHEYLSDDTGCNSPPPSATTREGFLWC